MMRAQMIFRGNQFLWKSFSKLKNRYCEICRRSKMTMRYHRRRSDEEKDETPPLHFGHRLRADHICSVVNQRKVQKASHHVWQRKMSIRDAWGHFHWMQEGQVQTLYTALQRFEEARGSDRSQCFVKTDCALELTNALEFWGWISESGRANDPFHNAKLESAIRRIKGGVRAIHLKAGFLMRCGLAAQHWMLRYCILVYQQGTSASKWHGRNENL